MEIRIALAGNPNSGKTTLFNALTGSNQFVGNWPGVTVEKKEGRMRGHDDVIITDLPGIYSLSPYSPEEIVARSYLIDERPDAILNIVDGTNLERNLYLTTQMTEIGIPVVVAVNMMDVVRRRGDRIDINALSAALGCPIFEISALKADGIIAAAEAAIDWAKKGRTIPQHTFSGAVEHALAHIEEAAIHEYPKEQQRWYAIKIFERDEAVLKKLGISEKTLSHIEEDIVSAERELDDDAESIITNERYNYIASILSGIYKKNKAARMTASEKIDTVVTNRFAALPIFALIMFLVYFISVTTIGTWVTDFTNDGLFGEGFHLVGIGSSEYSDAVDDYVEENHIFDEALVYIGAAELIDSDIKGVDEMREAAISGDFTAFEEAVAAYGAQIGAGIDTTLDTWLSEQMEGAPAPDEFGIFVRGVPVLVEEGLTAINCAPWLSSLVLDGIVGGVGAVLGFVPQILVLFLILSFLEACGYMSRIAFMMDKLFRKFGLSGKSFIPILVGTGCGVPGIMASRTIENENDRRMTIITTTFIPCGAKLPVIALISGALFGNAWWVAPLAYFIGVAAIVISGIILKKTKLFAGDVSPFVMELPEYHMPTFKNLLMSMWERGWSFIKKAGTIILLSTIFIWFGSNFGITEAGLTFGTELPLAQSFLGYIGMALSWLFAPLGFGSIETTVATLMGLIAKEEIVAVLGVLNFMDMTALTGFSFLVFNLLCAPCFAAMGAIRREMNSGRWTAFAIFYQCAFAYVTAFCIYQLGMLFSGHGGIYILGGVIAASAIAFAVYMMVRKRRA